MFDTLFKVVGMQIRGTPLICMDQAYMDQISKSMLMHVNCDVKRLVNVDIFPTLNIPGNAIYQTCVPAKYMIQPQYQAQGTVIDSQSQVRSYYILNTAC